MWPPPRDGHLRARCHCNVRHPLMRPYERGTVKGSLLGGQNQSCHSLFACLWWCRQNLLPRTAIPWHGSPLLVVPWHLCCTSIGFVPEGSTRPDSSLSTASRGIRHSPPPRPGILAADRKPSATQRRTVRVVSESRRAVSFTVKYSSAMTSPLLCATGWPGYLTRPTTRTEYRLDWSVMLACGTFAVGTVVSAVLGKVVELYGDNPSCRGPQTTCSPRRFPINWPCMSQLSTIIYYSTVIVN